VIGGRQLHKRERKRFVGGGGRSKRKRANHPATQGLGGRESDVYPSGGVTNEFDQLMMAATKAPAWP